MGNSLPVSRTKAVEELMKEDKAVFSEITETLNILSKPNNILAIILDTKPPNITIEIGVFIRRIIPKKIPGINA